MNEDELRKLIKREIHPENINWLWISMEVSLSESFIREFSNKLDWEYISLYQKLSESFIREFKDRIRWDYISIGQYLSESFIKEFQDQLEFEAISVVQTLSESLIRELRDKMYWHWISRYQVLSKPFIMEFRDKIDFYRPDICFDDIEECVSFYENFGKRYLSIWDSNQKISWNEFVSKYKGKYITNSRFDIFHLANKLEEKRLIKKEI